jgi:hypothetical protein
MKKETKEFWLAILIFIAVLGITTALFIASPFLKKK